MSDSELEQHMEWEITRNIPFGEKTVQSDFKAFPPQDAASQNMDVVMAISPQSAVEVIAGMVRKAGKKVAAIDVEPLGIARSLRVGYDNDLHGKTVCVVDIGHKTTSINIYKDGQLLMPRIVPIGGEMFTRSIADAMGVSFEQAEVTKIEKGEIPAGAVTGAPAPATSTQAFEPYNPFGDSAEDEPSSAPVPAEAAPAPTSPMFNAMAEVLDQLSAEVRRSIDYFRSKGGDVDAVFLAGGGSKLKGLAGFLEGAVGVRTKPYEPLRGLGQNIKVSSDSVDQANLQEFAVAVGNGLHICF
jgi:type IV pilus assembly protein PilM